MRHLRCPGTPLALIVSASVGAGHDGAAAEIGAALRRAGYATARLDFLDLMPGRTGQWLRASYAAQLRLFPRSWGPLLWLLALRPVAAAVGRIVAAATRRRLTAALSGTEELIISTYPLASQALGRLRRHGGLATPVVTYLCDPSVHPLWIATGVDRHIALHADARAQAVGHGAAAVAVCRPAVNPAFRPLDADERAAARARWGLPAGRIAVVVGGSGGVGDLVTTARHVAESGLATPVTVCGTNAALRQRLDDGGFGIALGWVDDMASLVGAADVVIQNAGGLTCLEAAAAGVPLLTYRSLPGHGATNAAVLRDAGLAPWPRTQRSFLAALQETLGRASSPRPHSRPPLDPPVIDQLRSWLPPGTPMETVTPALAAAR